jgi:hypothetical protein
MLREIISDANHRLARRWLRGGELDLLIWYEETSQVRNVENITAFELSDLRDEPVALKWNLDSGLTWHRIDEGESRPGHHKGSPLLLQQRGQDRVQQAQHQAEKTRALLDRLEACCGELDQETYAHIRHAALKSL